MDLRDQQIRAYLGKLVHVEVDRPMGTCHAGTVYPVNYGFLPGTLAGDGEPQDAYILGVDCPISKFDGRVIGIIRRKNDLEDKLVVAPEGMVFHQGQITQAVAFQEQHFETYVIPAFHKSAGVLPYRITNGQREFLLVLESFSRCWSIPKGHMEAGETEAQAALRELREETGLDAELDPSSFASVEYPISSARKQVVFFLGRVAGTPNPRPGEISDFRWVTEDQLANYLFPDTVNACETLLRR